MIRQLRIGLVVLLFFTALTGVVYPLVVTGIARVAFPSRAGGSLIERKGVIVGSELIGQNFDDARWFWGRPSATSPTPCNASSSSGSNLGPTNPALVKSVDERVARLRAAPGGGRAIPVDLVTTSASGLDPHISPAAALFQVPRIAAVRHIDAERVRDLVEDHIEGRTFGVLGEPRVNVLMLNLALDELH